MRSDRPSAPIRLLFLVAGLLSLGLGILGIILPILPTTPFVLLAAACFLRSSRRLYRWITSHRTFGPAIRGYLRYRAIGARTKVLALVTLWLVIGTTALFFVDRLWLRILLPAIAVGVTVYLSRMRTLTPEMREDLSRDRDSPPEDTET